MSGETETQVSGWTVDTLRYHLDAKMTLTAQQLTMQIFYERQISDERDRRYAERWAAQEDATKYAQEKANEFRGSLSDLSDQMATKAELGAAMLAMKNTADVQSTLLSEIRSRLDVGNPAVAALQQAQAQNAGISQGAQLTKASFYGALAAVGTLLGIVVLLANNVFK